MAQAEASYVAISAVDFHQQFLPSPSEALPTTSVTLDVPLPARLDPPILLTWAITDPETAPASANYTASCVWWKWDGLGGNWSTEGCRTVASSAEVQCLCDHLTEFAVHFVPKPNLVSAADFAAIPLQILEHPGLLILQGVLLLVFLLLIVFGYVFDKRNQVPGMH